jgi:hypothetical protein
VKKAIIRLVHLSYITIAGLSFFGFAILFGFDEAFEILFCNDFAEFLMDNME